MAKLKDYQHELKYDFFKLKPHETVLDAYPHLVDFPALKSHGSGVNDPLLRYAILLTDSGDKSRLGSRLIRILDIELRHRTAWEQAGLTPAHPRYQAAVLDFTDEPVAEMCEALLKEENAMMLAWILSAEITIWRDTRAMRQESAKREIFDELPGRIDSVNHQRERLFSRDQPLENATKEVARRNESVAGRLAREAAEEQKRENGTGK